MFIWPAVIAVTASTCRATPTTPAPYVVPTAQNENVNAAPSFNLSWGWTIDTKCAIITVMAKIVQPKLVTSEELEDLLMEAWDHPDAVTWGDWYRVCSEQLSRLMNERIVQSLEDL